MFGADSDLEPVGHGKAYHAREKRKADLVSVADVLDFAQNDGTQDIDFASDHDPTGDDAMHRILLDECLKLVRVTNDLHSRNRPSNHRRIGV